MSARVVLLAGFALGCTVDMPSRGALGDAASLEDALRAQTDRGPGLVDARPTPPDAHAFDAHPADARPSDARPLFDDRGAGGGAGLPDTGPAGGGFTKPDAGVLSDAVAPTDGGSDAVGDARAPGPDAAPCPGVPETCNGVDDDCNGMVDDSAGCGGFIQANCRTWMVWSDGVVPEVSPTWGNCPGAPEDLRLDAEQSPVCNSTRGDAAFYSVPFAGDVDANDMLGVAFTCDPGAGPAAAWLQANCRVFLAQIDAVSTDVVPNDTETIAGCPAANQGAEGSLRCVGSGGDGQFHAMQLVGNVNDDDRFAIAFRCDGPAAEGDVGQQRAATMTAAVRVFLAYSAGLDFDDTSRSDTWGDCPGTDRDNRGDDRCVSSAQDGRFHAINVGVWWSENVDWDDQFGIAMIGADLAP
jgi:hypothetical protein